MRTTVVLEDDVAAAIERIRRERSIGLSEAINELIRVGLSSKPAKRPYRHRTKAVDLRIDVTNVAEAIELLEGPDHR